MLTAFKHLFLVCLVLFSTSSVVEGRDYYDILKVSKGANDAQIKRAYRKLALIYHPDKVKGSDEEKQVAANKLAEINNAYEVLSDTEKRQIYDRYGEEGLKQQQQQRGGGGGGGGGNLFDMFFGGNPFGQGGEEEEQVKKGHDVLVDLFVTLKDLYVGKKFEVVRDKDVIKPASGTRKCNCKQRLVTRQLGPGMFQQFTQQVCEDCPNVKLVREQETIAIRVEPGMRDGEEIAKFEEGEPLIDGEPGDLKFFIRTLPDSMFTRQGSDLSMNKTITLLEALTGFRHEMEHLDGHTFVVESQGVTKPGDVKVISGQGMPVYNNEHRHGDLFITFTVAFPDVLTESQKEGVLKLFAA